MADVNKIAPEKLARFEKWEEMQEYYKVKYRKDVIEKDLYVLKAKASGIVVSKAEVDAIYLKKFGK